MNYEELKPKDAIGQEISVGDTVAVAKRAGNTASMEVRMVKSLSYDKGARRRCKWNVEVAKSESSRTGWTFPSRLVVITNLLGS